MAYLFLSHDLAFSAAERWDRVTKTDTTPRHDFTALEWAVVDLARRDRPSSLRDKRGFAIVIAAIFGARHNPRLANPKLEALRRLAVLCWHERSDAHSEAKAFLAAGFTQQQNELLMARITGTLTLSHAASRA